MTLRIENLFFERNDQLILQKINCELHAGDLLLVSGANGCGKSTFLRILSGFIEPQQGNIFWNNQSIFQHREYYYADVHYVGHTNGIKPYLTVYENLKLSCALQSQEATDIKKILIEVKLQHQMDTLAMYLSAGQMRRLCLARLLLQKKNIWILDEPSTALDVQGQKCLSDAVQKHRENGGIVIIASHHETQDPKNLTHSISLNHSSLDSACTFTKKDKNENSLAHPFLIMLQHEFLINFRQAFSWLTPLLFFIIVNCLFPIALGPDSALLKTIAPGVIWVTALLAVLISIGNIFRTDAEEGFLDLLLLSPHSFTLLVLCKIFSFWIMNCLPLIVLTPLLASMLNLNLPEQTNLMLTLLLGTPVLCLLGAIGSALIIGIRNHGVLLPILVMPLYVPVLIFGTGAVTTFYPVISYFAIMAAIFLLSVAIAPLLTSAALRIGVNQ